MKTLTPPARLSLLMLALFVLFIGTACVPTRLGVSWASMRLTADNNILVTYNDRIMLIDSGLGRPLEIRDSTGRVRTNEGRIVTWELYGSNTQSQFFASPWVVDTTEAGEEIAVVVDYNGKILTANLQQPCFSRADGVCLDTPPYLTINGRVSTDISGDDKNLYLPFIDHDVLALDKVSLSEVWRFPTKRGVWSTPIVIDDVVYFAEMGHEFYAVDALTGKSVWQLNLGGAVAASPVFYDGTPATDYADDAPKPNAPKYDVANGRFYAGSFARTISEISMDGKVTATFTTSDWVWSSPKIVDGILYTADLGGWVYALDTTNGLAPLWQKNTETVGIRARPLVTENYVIVISQNGVLVWLNRADGSVHLRQELNEETLSDLLYIPPVANRDALVIVSTINTNRFLFAFTIEGAQVWVYPPAS